jgi:hypothetical protein
MDASGVDGLDIEIRGADIDTRQPEDYIDI